MPSLFLVKSVSSQVCLCLESVWIFGYHFVNKLHLGSSLHSPSVDIRYRRQPGEEFKDKCVLPTVKHGGGIVTVWGCMSAAGTGELQFIEGTMNAKRYCDIL